MTRIVVEKSDVFACSKLSVGGHSGYSEEGSDIVCAYVSSATELLLGILIDQLGVDTETEISHDSADVALKILNTDNNIRLKDCISAVFRGFIVQMSDISEQFPKFVAITYA